MYNLQSNMENEIKKKVNKSLCTVQKNSISTVWSDLSMAQTWARSVEALSFASVKTPSPPTAVAGTM